MKKYFFYFITNKQSTHSEPEKEVNVQNKKSIFSSVNETIAAIGTTTGVFAALLYLGGRSYTAGYYSAMNIPEYMISFTLQEYGVIAWMPILVYPIATMIIGGLIWGIFSFILDLIDSVSKRLVEWIRKIIDKVSMDIKLPKFSLLTKQMFSLAGKGFLVLFIVIYILITMDLVSKIGTVLGRTTLLNESHPVEIISPILLPLVNSEQIITQTTSLTNQKSSYKDFRLLIFNNGKYFLFKELDPLTCKPLQVFILEKDQIEQIILSPATSLAGECQQGQIKQNAPIPTETVSDN